MHFHLSYGESFKSSIKHNSFPQQFYLEQKENQYACACEEDEGMVYFEDKYGQHCYCLFVCVENLRSSTCLFKSSYEVHASCVPGSALLNCEFSCPL